MKSLCGEGGRDGGARQGNRGKWTNKSIRAGQKYLFWQLGNLFYTIIYTHIQMCVCMYVYNVLLPLPHFCVQMFVVSTCLIMTSIYPQLWARGGICFSKGTSGLFLSINKVVNPASFNLLKSMCILAIADVCTP